MPPRILRYVVPCTAIAFVLLVPAVVWEWADPPGPSAPAPDETPTLAPAAVASEASEVEELAPGEDDPPPETTFAELEQEADAAAFDAAEEIVGAEAADEATPLPMEELDIVVARPTGLTRLAQLDGVLVMAVEDPWSADRVYAVEQSGRIVALDLATGEHSLFLDLSDGVLAVGESGMHSLAFHPTHPGRAFVFYNGADGGLALDELSVDREHGAAHVATTRLRIPAAYGAHNGGALAFGPDGMLYVSVGDGGEQGDPDNRAQDLASLHGKILRIDVDETREGYAVPSSNPFADGGGRSEIWLYGFRNPWRMSFDDEGDLWIADVGGSIAEEINVHPSDAPGGRNFGWRVFEGAYRHRTVQLSEVVMPIYEYPPANGRCAIVGGFVYEGPIATLAGDYLFADFCDGKIRALTQGEAGAWQAREIAKVGEPLVHLVGLRDGSVLAVGYGGGIWSYVAE